MLPAHEETSSIQLVTNSKHAWQVRSWAAVKQILEVMVRGWGEEHVPSERELLVL